MYYLKEINKIFKYYNIIKNSLILAVLIIVVDYLNIPTQFIQKDMFLSAIILLLFIILALLDIIFNKRYLLVVAKSINIIDKLLLTNIFSMIFYSIYLIIDFKLYKMIILVILIVAEFILIVCRLIYIRKLLKKQNVKKINTYDLKEFHEQDFSKSDANDLILFNENDVKYDLLNRSIFVNYISDVINQCNPQKSFVFALNGAWGSGKTTILNLVKDTLKSEKIIIIDNFNPWKYNSNETLFRGFYDSITKNENFDFDYSLYKKIYNVYKVLILGNDSIFNKINFDIHFGNNNYSVNELKSIIATYLKLNNKKVVYIIDNIDRLDKEQILIIFKTISTLFDFDNFVYLLSFDEVRVKKIFENELKIDANYLNKIINSSINLPNTNVDTIAEIAIKTIMKLFDYYDVENLEKTRFLEMFSKLSKKFKDIREMKRFLNYISAYIKSNDIQEQVNIGDFVIVQLLKYLNIDLYNTIYTNPTFFVSEDMMLCNMKSTEYFLTEKFNIVAKEFYQKLFDIKENEEYKEILTILFPYISNYNRGYEIKTTIPFNHDSSLYDDSVSNKRIFNGRYFEHYFELTPGKYANLLKEVNDFIKKNYKKHNEKRYDLISEASSDIRRCLFSISSSNWLNGMNIRWMFDQCDKEYNEDFIVRDAGNVDSSICVVLIGCIDSPFGLGNCGFCGFENCAQMKKAGTNCAFNVTDLGIAIGSTVSVAADHRIDNRVMYSAGKGAIKIGFLPRDVKFCYGIPLNSTSKSIYFDRNPGSVLR